MDQSNMLSIVGSIYDKLVADVSDSVIRRLKAEGSAQFTLESELLNAAIVQALEYDAAVRESIRDMVTDTIDNTNLSDNSEFQDLQREVESLQEKVEELDPAVIDADDSDFQDAVRSVIRNNI
jgi:hypothetical protein